MKPNQTQEQQLRSLFRKAAAEHSSYTETDTKRDLVRAADATVFTRFHIFSSLRKGPILMTLSTALAAAGLSIALWQMQPEQATKGETNTRVAVTTQQGASSNTQTVVVANPTAHAANSAAQSVQVSTPGTDSTKIETVVVEPQSDDHQILQLHVFKTKADCAPVCNDTSKRQRRVIVINRTIDSTSNGASGTVHEENTITLSGGENMMSTAGDTKHTKKTVLVINRNAKDKTSNGTIVRSGATADNELRIFTDSLFSTKAVLCDHDSIKIMNIETTGSPEIKLIGGPSGITMGNGSIGKPIDVGSRNALTADDFLNAIGIENKNGNYYFNDGSKYLEAGMHVDRYLSRQDNTIHIDWCKTNDTVIRDADRPKVSFRPMYIVDATGRIMEFSDAAVNAEHKMENTDRNILNYRDSCVSVVVHPDGKTPVYLLYYPSKEFLNALPRERSLQVLAEQGNADALKELQDSYRGCKYMSFCTTSNGAIEDTELLGSMSSDTRVKITLREPRVVRVAMYDIVGRLVAEIDKGSSYTAGDHVIPLSVHRESNQPATFYLLCITTDAGEKVSQRVVLGE